MVRRMSSFAPDSNCVTSVVPSPNHDERKSPVTMLLLHYTGMADAEVAIQRLCSAESRVSSHYVVCEDGQVVQCIPEVRRAWHAGVSMWTGETDNNSCSIGIEIVNPGHSLGYPDFPDVQLDAVIALCQDIIARNGISADRVLAHSDVAPSRKEDPGEKFPWGRLHAAGVGHWVEPAPLTDGPNLALGSSGSAVSDLQRALAYYGYGVPTTGSFDMLTRDVVTAFQRHFRPARVDGIADPSTIATLRALNAARSRKPLDRRTVLQSALQPKGE
jgi:N-acetylmuramoyl-L-alanine amidase